MENTKTKNIDNTTFGILSAGETKAYNLIKKISSNPSTDALQADMGHKSVRIVLSSQDKRETFLAREVINVKQEKSKEMYSRINKKLEVK